VNDLVIRAVALALQEVPEANAGWDAGRGEPQLRDSVDVAVAVATDKGLITPIVKAANTKSLKQVPLPFLFYLELRWILPLSTPALFFDFIYTQRGFNRNPLGAIPVATMIKSVTLGEARQRNAPVLYTSKKQKDPPGKSL